MEKVNKILTIIIIVLGVLLFAQIFSDSFLLRVKSIFKSDCKLIYEDSMLGDLYLTGLISEYNDKLAMYQWNRNFVLAGNIHFAYDSVFDKNADSIFKKFEDSRNVGTKISTANYELLFLTIRDDNNSRIISLVYDFINGRGLWIYGKDYTFEESCRAAQIILYGEPTDYTILVRTELTSQ
jgi:hypothetical protein